MVYFISKYPAPPPVPDSNVHELLFDSSTSLPDYNMHIDIITGHKRTFHEFKNLIGDVATALDAPTSVGGLGLSAQQGDIVGIYSYNCIDYIVLVHSLLTITVPAVHFSAYGTTSELTNALRTCTPTKLFVHPSLLSNALDAAKSISLSETHIYVLGGKVEGKTGFGDLVEFTRRRSIPRVFAKPARKDTLAYVMFSSGTTGLPKGVMISHGNIWSAISAQIVMKSEEDKVVKRAPLAQPPVQLIFLPFHHSFGLHLACFGFFLGPMTYLIVPKWDVEMVLRAIPKYRVNMIALIPSAIYQIVHHPLAAEIDWDSVLRVGSGTAYLPSDLAQTFMRHLNNVPVIFDGYGMSEQTLSAIRQPVPGVLGGIQMKAGATGILIPGMEGKIIRSDGSESNYDESGDLWVRGDNIALGYWNNEDATRETFVDGWLRTGDCFRIDRDGLLFFVDRGKDILKVSGMQVSPTEIEQVLLSHPDKLIQDVCVAGVRGGRTSDEKVPRAWIVLSSAGRTGDEMNTIESLDRWTRAKLSKYKWIRGGFEIVDEIPKLPTGKVLRRVLQNRYEQRNSITVAQKL